MIVKICGLQSFEDIKIVNGLKVNYGGFIFAPSKRYVQLDLARDLIKELNVKAVGVVVNMPLDELIKLIDKTNIDIVQLHGDENQEYIDSLHARCNIEIWKAIRIKSRDDLKQLQLSKISKFVVDSYDKSSYGGTGKVFNHKLLEGIDLTNVIIAGGITAANVQSIKKYNPFGIDVSSGVETNGIKDENKIKQLMEVVYE